MKTIIQYLLTTLLLLLFAAPASWALDQFETVASLPKHRFYHALALGDLNGDSWPDIVLSLTTDSGPTARIYLGTEAGIAGSDALPVGVGNVARYLQIADFNADGHKDILAFVYPSSADNPEEGTAILFLNDANGAFTKDTQSEVGYPEEVQTADFNRDGHLDFLYYTRRQENNRCVLFLNSGSGEFSQHSEFQIVQEQFQGPDISVADFNRDGFPDVSVTYKNWRSIDIFYGSQSLEFSPVNLDVHDSGTHAVADFNSDGRLDIAQVGRGILLNVYLQEPDGSFKRVSQHPQAQWSTKRAFDEAIDVDLDGDMDLVLKVESRPGLSYLENLGNGNFSKAQEFAPMVTPFDVSSEYDIFQGQEILIADINRTTDRVHFHRSTRTLGGIVGKVFYNSDGSCEHSQASYGVINRLVEIQPGAHLKITDRDGAFRISLPASEYTVSIVEDAGWQVDCELNVQTAAVSATAGESVQMEFPLVSSAETRSLSVSLVGSRARAGRELRYVLECVNDGSTPFDRTLELRFDEDLTFRSSSEVLESINNNLAVWRPESFGPASVQRLVLNFMVPMDAPIGTVYCAEVKADLLPTDETATDHEDEFCVEVTAGYDPNDIQVWPRGQGGDGRITRDVKTLTYMIRFQNTGNDTTFNVVVRDTLPAGLDVRRLRLGASSHAYTLDLLKNRILEFTFADIMLPDSTTDELGSQGFVKYRIDLEADLATGTELRNRAGIYFDFNPVVLTNDALTTIVEGVTSVDEVTAFPSLRLFPNPATDRLTVEGLDLSAATLELVDVLGRTVLRLALESQRRVDLSLQGLEPGTYFVQVRGRAFAGSQVGMIQQRKFNIVP